MSPEAGSATAGAGARTQSIMANIAALRMRPTLSADTLPHHGGAVNSLARSLPRPYAWRMADPRDHDEARRREALKTLDTLSERDTFMTSALARTAQRASDHFAAKDAVGTDGSVDRIELWGRRIGRALSLVGFVALAVYLYFTYFAK
jgi:hypothetical protein